MDGPTGSVELLEVLTYLCFPVEKSHRFVRPSHREYLYRKTIFA
jgi:hypothetical protein